MPLPRGSPPAYRVLLKWRFSLTLNPLFVGVGPLWPFLAWASWSGMRRGLFSTGIPRCVVVCWGGFAGARLVLAAVLGSGGGVVSGAGGLSVFDAGRGGIGGLLAMWLACAASGVWRGG